MTARLPTMTGVLTSLVFLGIGGWLISEGQTALGVVLVGLGILRGVVALIHVRATYFGSDEDED